LEESQEINAKVKKAAVYPVMMIWLTIIATAVLLIMVFPNIIDMYWDPSELPWITKFFLSASDYLRANWGKIILVVIAIIVAYNVAYSKWLLFKIWMDKLLLITPIVKNVVKLFYMSRFTSLLAQFYEAWVSPIIAFKLLASIFDNFHYKRKMIEVRNSINAWFSIYDSLEWTDLFDPILINIINVWENTWSLPNVLKRISPFYASTLKNNIDALMATLEPLLMCFIAWMIGSLLWAIYLPMADMVNQIN
jgi:type IV pilus assembly protein PilC